MANSSQSGNILGYASGTQPGLVSTTAQTFAGDKTLTGLTTASGGILNTGLTGANATTAFTTGSNKVGELKTVNGTSTTISASNLTIATISLTAGIYAVSALGVCAPTSTVTGVVYVAVSLTNNAFDNVSFIGSSPLSSSGYNLYVSSPVRYLNLTSTTSVYLVVNCNVVPPTGTWTTNSIIQAMRIA